MPKGKLCVIEGIDGAGGETQSKLLKEFLEKKNFKVELIKYPDYEGPIGNLIHEFLHDKYEFSPEVQFLLYATDMVKDIKRIENAKRNLKVVIADRYVTTTLSYQTLKGFPLESGLKFIKIFGLPKPDIIIFLDVSPKTSIKRKYNEKRSLDRHERDGEFLGKVRESYMNLIKKKILGEWVIIDGEKSIEEVAKEIQKIVLSKLSEP
jgi:dTMP kinase